MTPGEYLGMYRRRLGLSVQDVVKGLGCSEAFIHHNESGLRKSPSFFGIVRLARYYGCPMEELMLTVPDEWHFKTRHKKKYEKAAGNLKKIYDEAEVERKARYQRIVECLLAHPDKSQAWVAIKTNTSQIQVSRVYRKYVKDQTEKYRGMNEIRNYP